MVERDHITAFIAFAFLIWTLAPWFDYLRIARQIRKDEHEWDERDGA